MTTSATLPFSSEEVKPLLRVNTINLDSRFSKEDRVEQRRKGKEPMVEEEVSIPSTNRDKLSSHARLILDGDFEIVPLGEDPTRGVKPGADLPDLIKGYSKLA